MSWNGYQGNYVGPAYLEPFFGAALNKIGKEFPTIVASAKRVIIRHGPMSVEIGSEIATKRVPNGDDSSVLRASAGAFIPQVFEVKAKGKENEEARQGPDKEDEEDGQGPDNHDGKE